MSEMEGVRSQIGPDMRMLEDHEVDAVNGGLVVIAIIAVLIGLLVPAVQTTRPIAQ